MFRLPRLKSAHDSDNPRAPWQVAIELNRLLALIIIFMAGLVGFVVIWHQTHPIKESELLIVEFQTGGNNFVQVTKAGKDMTRNEALIKAEARRYVMMREIINRVDDPERYATVRAMSNEKVWTAFKNLGASLLRQDGLKQEIHIIQDSKLAAGAHQVEFQMRRYTEGVDDRAKVPCTSWTASMAYEFDSQKVRFDDAVKNFSGWQTMEYTLSKRSDDTKCKF